MGARARAGALAGTHAKGFGPGSDPLVDAIGAQVSRSTALAQAPGGPVQTLPLLPTIGVPELLIILVIVLIFFGVGKLPQIGKALGEGIKGFKEGAKDQGTADDNAARGQIDMDQLHDDDQPVRTKQASEQSDNAQS